VNRVSLSVMIELGTVKWKMMSWMKSTACLEEILARGFTSTHLVNLLITTSRWVKPSGAFLKRPRRFLGQGMDLSGKVLASPAGSHYLCRISGRSRPIKTLLESLPDHAPLGSIMPADPFMDIKE
jgi:hypothetical protein